MWWWHAGLVSWSVKWGHLALSSILALEIWHPLYRLGKGEKVYSSTSQENCLFDPKRKYWKNTAKAKTMKKLLILLESNNFLTGSVLFQYIVLSAILRTMLFPKKSKQRNILGQSPTCLVYTLCFSCIKYKSHLPLPCTNCSCWHICYLSHCTLLHFPVNHKNTDHGDTILHAKPVFHSDRPQDVTLSSW